MLLVLSWSNYIRRHYGKLGIFYSNCTRKDMKYIYITSLFDWFVRAMAVNILMVAGRFGGVVGSNVTAILVDSYCEYAFYVPGCLFTGKIRFFRFLSTQSKKNSMNLHVPTLPIDSRFLKNCTWIIRQFLREFEIIRIYRATKISIFSFPVVAFLVFLIPYKENSLRSNKVSTSNSRASENSSYETVIL